MMKKLRLLALILLAVPSAALAQEPRKAGGETVDVEIKMIPFYALDAQGKPVYDLKPDEVELRVGGKPVPIDTLDGYPMTGAPQGTPAMGKAATPPSRHVLLLFDSAFSSTAGFRNARLVADKLLAEVPGRDRLYLLTHSAARGLEKKLGPVRADEPGKEKLRREIARLVPEVNRLSTDAGSGLPPIMQGKGGGRQADVPTSQFMGETDSMQGFARSEYEGVARQMAESLAAAAADLRRTPGPKLLVIFWQGLDPQLFFQGDMGVKPGSTSSTSIGGQRFGGIMTRFTEPLRALADSGTMTVLVNATAPQQRGADIDGPLRQMALTVGGYYASGGDPQDVERQVATATAAYYEAGFYVRGPRQASREPVEVVVRRPGVRVWAPASLKVRESYDALSSFEKRLLVLDLVAGGPEVQRARSAVRLDLRDLDGKVLKALVRSEKKEERHLRFDAAWPADLAGRELDLYNVMLVPPPPHENVPKVLRFDQAERAHLGALPLETALGKEDKVIWGIVAVEPETGRAWYKRLELKGEGAGR
jgi:hypothetical protein